ncbi:MAG: hypothetical protein V7686_05595 [Qipengyuania sp.]
MTKAKLGNWRWYVGSDETDDEMMDSGTREQAIADGKRAYSAGESFYVVEARMRLSDERAMERGTLDTAPFEESRNGQWIKA